MRRSGTDEVIALDWRVVDDTRLELTSTEGYELVFIIEAFNEDSLTVSMEGYSGEMMTFQRVGS